MNFLNFFLIFLTTLLIPSESKSSKIELVHVFFRHGARTPEIQDAIPTDPYGVADFSPMGWGQLTNLGKQNAHNLGQLLRRRYATFLGDIYSPKAVKAYSTDFDRTKMTALLVLAGLFPPSVSQTWNESIAWQPIPYHYEKDKYDYTLRRPNSYCPTYMKELEEVLSSDQAEHDIKSNRKLFQYIEKHTKKPIKTLSDVFRIYQTLNAEKTMNLTLPDWTKSVFPDQITDIAAKQAMYENYNAILKRLNGGRSLSNVLRQISARVNRTNADTDTKIYLYSGHENNVINILAALNLFQPHIPKYSAAVIIELHFITDTKKYAVKVYYARDVNSEPELQLLEDCDALCPLNSFLQIVQPHVPGNFTAECHSHVDLD